MLKSEIEQWLATNDLQPDLCMGVMLESFQSVGNLPVERVGKLFRVEGVL